jgi:hypothetical protein
MHPSTALSLGIVAIAATGCGATTTKTVSVHKGPQTVTQTITQTVPTHGPSPATQAHATSEPSAAPQEYSGSGGKNLGEITVAKESTLEWTNDGAYLGIYTDKGVPVNSYAHSGTTVLEAATYSKFYVNALGNWTIKIVPR